MTRTLIIKLSLPLVALLLVILLFSLPKEVVKSAKEPENKITKTANDIHKNHTARDMNLTDRQHLVHLKQNFFLADSLELKKRYEDTIFNIYQKYTFIDSIAYFLDEVALKSPSLFNWERAGNGFFNAFISSQDEGLRKKYGNFAVRYFDKVISREPESYHLDTRKAVVSIETEVPPMKGVRKLKGILEEYPQNSEGWIYLAEFQIRINMVDKAIISLKNVLRFEPNNIRVLVRLAEIYAFRKDIELSLIHI